MTPYYRHRHLLDCPNCGSVPHPGRTCSGLTNEQITSILLEIGAKQYPLPPTKKHSKKGEFGW